MIWELIFLICFFFWGGFILDLLRVKNYGMFFCDADRPFAGDRNCPQGKVLPFLLHNLDTGETTMMEKATLGRFPSGRRWKIEMVGFLSPFSSRVPSELDRRSPSTRGRCTSKPGPKPVLRRQAQRFPEPQRPGTSWHLVLARKLAV